jgi:hypothetical protein
MANDRARRFDPVTVARDGVLRRIHQIVCRECGATDEVSANTHSGARAHEDLRRVFGRRGWELGRHSDQDVCPGCTGKGKEERMAKTPVTKTAQVVPLNGDITSPPRDPSFEDRRIIIAALQDHYLNEREGYAPGWTDHKIAADLAVPRKWVEDIRAAMFGPVKDNEDIRAFVEEARAALKEARDLVGPASVLDSKLTNLERRLVEFEKAMH